MTAHRDNEPPATLREQQREVTRAWICKAARTCFARDDVKSVAMAVIAAEAGIGRATLYLYYDSKHALLLDLLGQSLRATDRIYRRLVDLPEISAKAVRGWLTDYLREVEEHAQSVDLFHGEIAADEHVRAMMRAHTARTIAMLGEHFAYFDLTRLEGALLLRRRIEAELSVAEIEAFCAVARLPDYPHDRDTALDIMAERLAAVLSRQEPIAGRRGRETP